MKSILSVSRKYLLRFVPRVYFPGLLDTKVDNDYTKNTSPFFITMTENIIGIFVCLIDDV